MKKIISLFTCFAIMLSLLSGCAKTEAPAKTEKKLSIVTTIFPEYDWVMQLLGERAKDAEVTLLLDSGVDLHSFQPSAKDIVTISSCDLFVYVGGESDKWVADALAGAANKDMLVLDLMELLREQVKEEELIEGMQAHEEEHGEEEEHDEEPEYDEHVWLSLRSAGIICQALRDALITLDEANKAVYTANAEAYLNKLDALDKQYQQAVDSSDVKTLLFGDRFPFRYLTDDYGLSYYAAFPGCSAETEASFETIVFLADKLKEENLPHVMVLEGSDHKIAKTIIETAGMPEVSVLSLNSMQSCTMKDVSAGVSYLSIMEKNLEMLKAALNREA